MIRYATGRACAAVLLLGLAWGGMPLAMNAANGSEPPKTVVPHNQDRPPNAPRTAEEAARAMTVPPGFRVEVVAAEPDIVNPVAMTFDERGRVWITESLEYPRHAPGPGRDRIKVLEDTDGDGKADRFHVFADGLNIPSGIAVGHGGVWVCNAPDLLFFQDTDGDGKADVKEVVATGFGRSDTHELPNSLTWGPDGWLYGWNGVFNSSKVASKNGKTYQFTCAIFRVHPKTRVFEVWCEGTSNPWGIAIDPEGSFFSSACVIDHLWHLVETGYYIRQGGPYPPHTWPIGSIVDHRHQKAAYCGAHYFDSPAYPEAYRGQIYMGNIHGNAINVDALARNGSTYRAQARPDFLRANDAWFMPVSQKTGPDGCLYVLDWYDQYHCYQDANRDPAGIDRLKGRLYRVRYLNAPRRFGFDLSKSKDEELIALLRDPNVYVRDIAQRLLCERTSPSVRARLAELVFDDDAERKARMHGLWALIGSGPLDPNVHARLLEHADPTFRAWGVRAAGNQDRLDETVHELVLKSGRDPSADVRLQAAIAARKIEGAEPAPVLLDALMTANDPLIPHVVWQNIHPILYEHRDEIAQRIEQHKGPSAGLNALAPRALELLLQRPDPGPRLVRALLRSIDDDPARHAAIEAFIPRLKRHSLPRDVANVLRDELGPPEELAGGALAVHDSKILGSGTLNLEHAMILSYLGDQPSFKAVWNLARSPWNERRGVSRGDWERLRLRAVEAVLDRRAQGTVPTLIAGILAEREPDSSPRFRDRAIDALGELDGPEVAGIMLKAYGSLEPGTRPHAIELLVERPAWAKALLQSVAAKTVPASALNLNQVRQLQRSRRPEIVKLVASIWGQVREGRDPGREKVVKQVRAWIRKRSGDPFAGQAVFQKLCAQCHTIYGQGQDVGPDITSNGRNDFEQLLSNVFDPSLVIGPGYQATTIATADGRVLTGLLAENGAERVVLKVQGGQREIVPRDQVDELKTSNVSLMPEQIENQLTPQEIVDLFAFLCLDRPPEDPAAKSLPGAGKISRDGH